MRKPGSRKGNAAITVIILIAIAGIAVYSLFIFRKNSGDNAEDTQIQVAKDVEDQNTGDVSEEIMRDLQLSGVDCGSGKCTVDTVSGNFAKGTMPMAYWIASKTDGRWKVVVSGNGIPSCEEIDTNSIPKEIYGNCLETSGELRHE